MHLLKNLLLEIRLDIYFSKVIFILGGEDAEIFRNRKGTFSINVQTVSDANLKICDIVARWPGSTHDQTIFNNSLLKRKFEDGNFNNFVLLGDSGYANSRYLLTPFGDLQTRPQNVYNESHIRTRNTVERQYGLWKRRFPVLSKGMSQNVEAVLNIIVATAVLHNIAIDMREPEPPQPAEEEEEEINQILNAENVNQDFTYRDLLVAEHFSRF